MQSLHKNEKLLFEDFQDFLVRTQQFSQKLILFYLRWVNRFHRFCSWQHLDDMEKEEIEKPLPPVRSILQTIEKVKAGKGKITMY